MHKMNMAIWIIYTLLYSVLTCFHGATVGFYCASRAIPVPENALNWTTLTGLLFMNTVTHTYNEMFQPWCSWDRTHCKESSASAHCPSIHLLNHCVTVLWQAELKLINASFTFTFFFFNCIVCKVQRHTTHFWDLQQISGPTSGSSNAQRKKHEPENKHAEIHLL